MQAERLKILLELLEDEPNDPFNRYAVAMEYLSAAPNEALQHLKKLLEQHPNYLPTYYQAATLYAEQDLEAKATDVFEKGIALAAQQNNEKATKELKAAFRMYQDEWEM